MAQMVRLEKDGPPIVAISVGDGTVGLCLVDTRDLHGGEVDAGNVEDGVVHASDVHASDVHGRGSSSGGGSISAWEGDGDVDRGMGSELSVVHLLALIDAQEATDVGVGVGVGAGAGVGMGVGMGVDVEVDVVPTVNMNASAGVDKVRLRHHQGKVRI